MSKHLCIIPARAGSKSIIDKNLIMLPANNKGKTITRWAVEHARESNIFGHILVTSDIQPSKINLDGLTGNAMTKVEYIKRPAELCTDNALMMDVVKHAINYIGGDYTYVWLLQPTSPFRDVKDFKVIKSIIESGIYNSVISYKETKDHPNRTYTIKEEDDKITAHPLRHVNFKNKQDLIPVYIRSGNFYVSKVGAVMETNTFENKPIYPYIVDKIKGINIDSEEDMILAKHYLNYGTVKL